MKVQEFYEVLMQQLNSKIHDFFEEIVKNDKELVIWGTNNFGQTVSQELKKYNPSNSISFFGDNDSEKWNQYINDTKVLGIDFFEMEPNKYYVIICSFWENEIANQLDSVGIEYTRDSWPIIYKEMLQQHYERYNENEKYNLDIENVWNVFKKAQELYANDEIQKKLEKVKTFFVDDCSKIMFQKRIDFVTKGDLSLISDYFTTTLEYFQPCYYSKGSITCEEIFVDCGAYTGDTIESFLDAVNGKYNQIYAYEPDDRCYDIANKYITDRQLDVRLVKKGVGEFTSEGDFPVISLDEDIHGEVTWIKMDIEGFELSALKGARRLIQTYKPKLTICLYHNVEDIYEIPLYLKELVPEYQFKVSQHFRGHYDFVLYADVYNK